MIDADITGPSIPKLLAIEDQRIIKRPDGIGPGDARGRRAGGGKKAAEEFKVQFLGAIPLDPDIAALKIVEFPLWICQPGHNAASRKWYTVS